MIWQDGKMHPAKPRPCLDTMEIDATIWTHLLATTDRRFECYDGLNPRLGVRALVEAPTRYTWHGEAGAGWSERGSSFATPR